MKKLCFKKVQKCLKERLCFFTCYERKNLAMFFSTKGFIYALQKLNVAYCLTCPRCDKKYIDKTDHNLATRLNEQGSPDDQPMYQHLSKCECYNNIVNLMKLPDNDSTTAVIDKRE